VPTGIELETALRGALERGNDNAAEPLALWLAFHGRPKEALEFVEHRIEPTSSRLAGLVRWKGLGDAPGAVAHLEAGPVRDAVAVVELDQLYAELGLATRRVALLDAAPDHRLVVERRAHLALAQGNPAEALRLLSGTSWPCEHQRYVRTELWRQAQAALGQSEAPVPDSLNEDNLAPFGAYWSDT
jgi:hypothetical protein